MAALNESGKNETVWKRNEREHHIIFVKENGQYLKRLTNTTRILYLCKQELPSWGHMIVLLREINLSYWIVMHI